MFLLRTLLKTLVSRTTLHMSLRPRGLNGSIALIVRSQSDDCSVAILSGFQEINHWHLHLSEPSIAVAVVIMG